MPVTPITRDVPLAKGSPFSPIFHVWGNLPWTRQTAAQVPVLQVRYTPTGGQTTADVTCTSEVFTFRVNGSTVATLSASSYATVADLAAAVTAIAGGGWTGTVLNNTGTLVARQVVASQDYPSFVNASQRSAFNTNISFNVEGTTEGDELIKHPNFRCISKVNCQEGSSDFNVVPGFTPHGYDLGEPTIPQIAARLLDWAKWQAFYKGTGTEGDGNYEGAMSLVGYVRDSRNNSYIHGHPDDRVGDDTLHEASFGPFRRYSPFAANAIGDISGGIYQRTAELASEIKAQFDAPDLANGAPNGYCYPAFGIMDEENHIPLWEGALFSDWRAGSVNVHDGRHSNLSQYGARGSLLHGRKVLFVTAPSSGTWTWSVTGEAGNGVMTLTNSSGPGTVSLTLTKTTTVLEVVNFLSSAGWAGSTQPGVSLSDPFFTYSYGPLSVGTNTNQGIYVWSVTWPVEYYRGWLELLIHEPTNHDLDRRATEIIYEEWNGTQFVGRTFDYWWASMVSKGLYNFRIGNIRLATGLPYATNSERVNDQRWDIQLGQNQNQKQRVRIKGSPTGGSFSLTFNGSQTGAIPYNASAGTVQAALEALPNLSPGDITVTGGSGPATPWVVEFTGAYAGTNPAIMTVTVVTPFSGGVSPSIAVTEAVRAATGITVFNHWRTAGSAGDGLTEINSVTGYPQGRSRSTAFMQELLTLMEKCIFYRYKKGVIDAMRLYMPFFSFMSDYSTHCGGSATRPAREGSNNPNLGTVGGKSPSGAHGPAIYRVVGGDAYGGPYGTNYKSPGGTWQDWEDASLLYLDEYIDNVNATTGGDYVTTWLCELNGEQLSIGANVWTHRESYLRAQIQRLLQASLPDRAPPGSAPAKWWNIVWYANPAYLGMIYGYRPTTTAPLNTKSSDALMLSLLRDAVSYAAKHRGPRRRT